VKVLLQRVSEAAVRFGGETAGAVGRGYMALVGCRAGDTAEDCDRLAVRTANLRVFEDDAGRMNRSVVDVAGAVLAISQFTLYADTRKGNRPSFVEAGDPAEAELLYERFLADLRSLLGPDRVAQGRFGADMKVALVNDGPCTIELKSEVALCPTPAPRPRLPLPALSLVPVETDAQIAEARTVAEKTWPRTYAGIIPDAQIPYMIERMYAPEAIRRDTAEGTPFFLVKADGRTAGVCSADLGKRDADGAAELHKLYVLPQYWSRGVGHWVLDELSRRCREAGAASVWLRVNKRNERAQKAYKAAGFAKERAVCTDIGGGFVMDDFVYRRTF
jgi:D-tyrosyl-tRNA(Tyr) deacylase